MKDLLKNIILLTLLNTAIFLQSGNIYVGLIISLLLTYLPGKLILSAIKYDRRKSLLERISISTGLGVLFLMILGLGINEILPQFNIAKPLSVVPFMTSYNIATISLIIIKHFANRDIKKLLPAKRYSIRSILFVVLSFLLPISGIIGAITLNSGGSNIVALLTYIAIGIYAFSIFLFNKKLSSNQVSFALFIMSLTLLFMNSFRGWYNTGHDIQREFYVFSLTNEFDRWDMNLYRDPYMACLSLTILPTIFSNIAQLNDYYIFKTIYQIIFSFTVVNIFFIFKRYIPKAFAYIAALNFLFFPTFMTDMSMLNRQELAFFFLSLMIYVLFDRRISKMRKTLLFIIMSSGMIFSHYSTSYVIAALIAATYGAVLFSNLLGKLPIKKITQKMTKHLDLKQNINLTMVTFVLGFTVFWNSFYTNSSENLQYTLTEITSSLANPFSEKEKTGETLYSIFNYKPVPPEVILDQYVEDKTKELRLPNEVNGYYPKEIYEKYPLRLSEQEVVEPTLSPFKNFLQDSKVMDFLRQSYAKFMQIFILIGLVVFIFSKRQIFMVPKEFYLLSIISLMMITAQVILPQSAISYGVLRFFQQSIIFFSPFILLGLFWALRLIMIKKEFIRETIIMCFMLVYFLLLSGVIPQLIGGYYPQLPLNNNGAYYNMYYTHKSEITALNWVGQFTDKNNPLQSDSFDAAKIKTYAKTFPISATFPAVIRKDSYVYLNYSNAFLNSVYIYYGGRLLIYDYPIEFLDENKNLIYNSKETKIYK